MSKQTMANQKGLTLVELMLALALGLLLSAGALMMFIGNKETATFQEQFARVQENGRFASDVLMRSIRPAAYWGCGSSSPKIINALNVGTGADEFDFSLGLYGYEAKSDNSGWEDNSDSHPPDEASGSPSTTIAGLANAGSDILMIRTIEGADCRILTHATAAATGSGCTRMNPTGKASGNLTFSEQCGLATNDIVMISDCVDAAIFQLTNVTGTGVSTGSFGTGAVSVGPGNCSNQIGKVYAGDSISKINSYIFMVRNNAAGVPALYRYSNDIAEELIEGVEEMHFTYGEDTNGDGAVDTYVTADNVTDWDNVFNVRMSVLVRSFNTNVLDTAQAIGIDRDGDGTNETVTGADLRVRQVFSTTVTLRNRMS